MRILILNWKDIRHPAKGGAEVLTHEIAERWGRAGHQVTIFAPSFTGALSQETINGVDVVRAGNRLSVYLQAFRYVKRRAAEFDRIIDQVNTLPFWTPFYVDRSKRLMLIHQLAREVWFYELPKWLAWIGYVAEPLMLKVYRNERTITVSGSTRDDLLALGFRKDRVRIMPEGIDVEPVPVLAPKLAPATFLFAGRLTPMKRVDHIIEAFRIAKQQRPEARLSIVGSGAPEYVALLKKQASDIDGVTFHGHVTLEEKRRLMETASVIVGASVREGWGLFISEGAALGTPSVVYNVPGLRDSTIDGKTGLVVSDCNPASLAHSMAKIISNDNEYQLLRRNAWAWASEMTWDRAAAVSCSFLDEAAWT